MHKDPLTAMLIVAALLLVVYQALILLRRHKDMSVLFSRIKPASPPISAASILPTAVKPVVLVRYASLTHPTFFIIGGEV